MTRILFTAFMIIPLLSLASTQELEAYHAKYQKEVAFWIDIFTKFTTSEGVIHDTRYTEIIYERLNVTGFEGEARRQMIARSKLKWRNALKSLASRPGSVDPLSLSPEEAHVYRLFEGIEDPFKFEMAARKKRLRFQGGQKESLIQALQSSRKYLPKMERIFFKEGLPVELCRIPLVESAFNLKSRSMVGASGIWQFLPSTGRRWLRIDAQVDERNDPLRSTRAAAKLLKENYERLQDWGLAVTAFNHGTQSLLRAKAITGNGGFDEVYRNYHDRSFGFASRNYFFEVLAAIEVEKAR